MGGASSKNGLKPRPLLAIEGRKLEVMVDGRESP